MSKDLTTDGRNRTQLSWFRSSHFFTPMAKRGPCSFLMYRFQFWMTLCLAKLWPFLLYFQCRQESLCPPKSCRGYPSRLSSTSLNPHFHATFWKKRWREDGSQVNTFKHSFFRGFRSSFLSGPAIFSSCFSTWHTIIRAGTLDSELCHPSQFLQQCVCSK